jgi:hypothetical protein
MILFSELGQLNCFSYYFARLIQFMCILSLLMVLMVLQLQSYDHHIHMVGYFLEIPAS